MGFHDSILVRDRPRKCCRILSQILYLQNDARSQASKLTRTEATDLFFASTKLFVDVKDPSLRRLVYLFIKEIQLLCDRSDIIIVTSCLTKDMVSDNGMYRANAIRALVNIIDDAMLGSIERYIKQAIVDNDLQVSNAALVSACHLFERSSDSAAIIRRWIHEVQASLINNVGTDNDMVQANAMRLLCLMKNHDRLGMAKLLQKFSVLAGEGIQSPAIVILIRLCGKLLLGELSNNSQHKIEDVRKVSPLCKLCFEFLDSSLSHSNSMVSYEATRVMLALPGVRTHDLSHSFDCLKSMLLSEKPAVRFAAARTLSEATTRHPRAVALCNEGLIKCIGDSNKQTVMFAVTTLLKTGSEDTIDRILRDLAPLLASIQDEYKITLLSSLCQLCLKYSAKHRAIVAFLVTLLREEGGFDFKLAIVDAISSLIRQVPETADSSLFHLCNFIEDCEYTMLSTHTIHIIADFALEMPTPSRYIRYIYNRVILENATIRSASVAALSKISAQCPSVRSSIVTLLKQVSLHDDNDETRDRASMAVEVLTQAMALNPYVAPVAKQYDSIVPKATLEGDVAALVYLQPLPMTFTTLERSLKALTQTPGAMESMDLVTFSTLPFVEDATAKGESESVHAVELKHNDPAAAVYAIPELADLGRVIRSSPPFSLTEEETEYVVRCVKHVLDQHVILQFLVQNTVENQQIQNVAVEVETDSDVYEIIGEVPCETIKYGTTASVFTVLRRPPIDKIELSHFSCQLNFTVIPVDSVSSEVLGDSYAEEYPLEELLMDPSDYMSKISISDFPKAWHSTNDSNEAREKFTLAPQTLNNAMSAIIDLLGMASCAQSTRPPENALGTAQQMLHLSGMFLGRHQVLARAQLTARPGEGTLLHIAIRSDDKAVCGVVMSCIH